MADVDVAAPAVDPVQADLEIRLARLWASIEYVDRWSWRLLEGTAVDDDARAALTAAYTSATEACREHGLADVASWAVRSTLAVAATIEHEATWAAKRWVEYAALALVSRSVVQDDDEAGPELEGVAVPGRARSDEPDGTEADAAGSEPPGVRLVGGAFGWAEYEVLTWTWRSVVGEIHPGDPPLTVEPEPEEDPDAAPWWADPVDDAGDEGTAADEADARPGVDRLDTVARARMGAVWAYLTRPIALPITR